MRRRSLVLMGFPTHVVLVVVRSPGHGGGGGVRGDDGLPETLQAGGEVPQHGGVSHWRELVMTWAQRHTGSNTTGTQGYKIQIYLDNAPAVGWQPARPYLLAASGFSGCWWSLVGSAPRWTA